MTTEFIYFICKQCDARQPGNKANTFGTRKKLREHLKEHHNLKHEGGSGLHKIHQSKRGATCHCLSQREAKGKYIDSGKVSYVHFKRIAVQA